MATNLILHHQGSNCTLLETVHGREEQEAVNKLIALIIQVQGIKSKLIEFKFVSIFGREYTNDSQDRW